MIQVGALRVPICGEAGKTLTFPSFFSQFCRGPISDLGTNVKEMRQNEDSSRIKEPAKRLKVLEVKFFRK
jgi:hypothetical protein